MFNKLFPTLSTATSNAICHSEPCMRNLNLKTLRYLTFVRYDTALRQLLYFIVSYSFHCYSKCDLSFRTVCEESEFEDFEISHIRSI